jgi:hypothetical protein
MLITFWPFQKANLSLALQTSPTRSLAAPMPIKAAKIPSFPCFQDVFNTAPDFSVFAPMPVGRFRLPRHGAKRRSFSIPVSHPAG